MFSFPYSFQDTTFIFGSVCQAWVNFFMPELRAIMYCLTAVLVRSSWLLFSDWSRVNSFGVTIVAKLCCSWNVVEFNLDRIYVACVLKPVYILVTRPIPASEDTTPTNYSRRQRAWVVRNVTGSSPASSRYFLSTPITSYCIGSLSCSVY